MTYRRIAALACCVLTAVPAVAQDVPFGPRSDFGRIVLSDKQSAGGVALEKRFGAGFDAEPAYQFAERSGYRRLGRSIGRLDIASSRGTNYCTAFLISEKHLMTNGHCFQLGEGIEADAALFIAGYVENGVTDFAKQYVVNPKPLEFSPSGELDFAILEVFGAPSLSWGTLPLDAPTLDPVRDAGLPLIVIGHPDAMAQHISRKECRAATRNPLAGDKLRHTCDTLIGNSGSPVIADDGRTVIALHHGASKDESVNFAIPMHRIAAASPIVAELVAQTAAARRAREDAAARIDALEQDKARTDAERRAYAALNMALSEADLLDRIILLEDLRRAFPESFAAGMAKFALEDARRARKQQAEQTAAIKRAEAAEHERKRLAEEKAELERLIAESRPAPDNPAPTEADRKRLADLQTTLDEQTKAAADARRLADAAERERLRLVSRNTELERQARVAEAALDRAETAEQETARLARELENLQRQLRDVLRDKDAAEATMRELRNAARATRGSDQSRLFTVGGYNRDAVVPKVWASDLPNSYKMLLIKKLDIEQDGDPAQFQKTLNSLAERLGVSR